MHMEIPKTAGSGARVLGGVGQTKDIKIDADINSKEMSKVTTRR